MTYFTLETKCKCVYLNGIVEAGIVWWVLALDLLELILYMRFSSMVKWSALTDWFYLTLH